MLNAFPLPTPNAITLSNGLAQFISSWSNPSQADTTSIRLDQNIGQRTHLFFRFSGTPSSGDTRGNGAGNSPATVNSSVYLLHSYTFGAAYHVAHNIDNDLRLNYTSNTTSLLTTGDTFGGATPVDLNQLQGLPENSQTNVYLNFTGYNPRLGALNTTGAQKQWNLVDTVTLLRGKHSLKAGVDWRRLEPTINPANVVAIYFISSAASVTANSVNNGSGTSNVSFYPLYTNFSAFVQDEWKVTPRLNVSAGIRWDVNPAPGVTKGLAPYTVTGLDRISTLALAPQGTSLWNTSWYNIAPRLGVAYILNDDPRRETVIRAGGGVFFDTGQQTGSEAFGGPGLTAVNTFGSNNGKPISFPAPLAVLAPPIASPPVPPYGAVYTNPTHLAAPYTYQWNVSLEQALGQSQSFTLSYVGSNGRKLLGQSYSNISAFNPKFTSLYIFQNELTSSYNSLQVKFQRQVARGLQALGSYTWSHNLDYGSYNAALPYQRGDSDYDVRNNATIAISYELPRGGSSSMLHALTSGWGIDGRFTARSGFPVTLNGNQVTDPNTGIIYYGGLNVISGKPLYLYGPGSTYPGGRTINPGAFSLPATGQYGNAPRNFVDGFGAVQADVALRRAFHIHESFGGQFRVEAFNVLNHPNFGSINTTYGNLQFGQATAILSQSLGVLSPLYQMGGPRSLQLSLRLTFRDN